MTNCRTIAPQGGVVNHKNRNAPAGFTEIRLRLADASHDRRDSLMNVLRAGETSGMTNFTYSTVLAPKQAEV
jgi:hypothetical protein